MKKIIISGGWGYGNIGDEAIAANTLYLVDKYFSNYKEIIMSYSVQEFSKHHSLPAIQSLHAVTERFDFSDVNSVEDAINKIDPDVLKQFISAFQESSIFIMSGGGYLHELWVSQFWARMIEIELAKKYGNKIAVIGQSIGPFTGTNFSDILKNQLSKVDYLAVRDKSSYHLLKENLKIEHVRLTTDIAVISQDVYPVKQNNKHGKLQINVMPASFDYYVSIDSKPRKIKGKIGKIIKRLSLDRWLYIKTFKNLFRDLCKINNAHVNVVVSTEWAWNLRLIDKLTKGLPKDKCSIIHSSNVRMFCETLGKGDIIISTKLHPIIVSSAYNILGIAISYNYKVDDYMKSIGCEKYCIQNNRFWKFDTIAKVNEILRNIEDKEIGDFIVLLKNKVYGMFEEMKELFDK